uniref:Uncharacterized protein n=1 Tax=Podoviridae sp. ctsNK10 TaxID=2826582 RepID=A0A8S5NLT1_9CAUD|nr:MAG TPA: hypothetical protein [Podoviridae sp. ctsNK10]DAT92368.1 MAG TPA: hypothetical protein [Caudoviricetes sp.]
MVEQKRLDLSSKRTFLIQRYLRHWEQICIR